MFDGSAGPTIGRWSELRFGWRRWWASFALIAGTILLFMIIPKVLPTRIRAAFHITVEGSQASASDDLVVTSSK